MSCSSCFCGFEHGCVARRCIQDAIEGKRLTLAVDFDGFLVPDEFPTIGEFDIELVELLRSLRKEGHYLVLWTNRENVTKDGYTFNFLGSALEACHKVGLCFDGVNENLESKWSRYKGHRRKLTASIYLDDRMVGFNMDKVKEFLKELLKATEEKEYV